MKDSSRDSLENLYFSFLLHTGIVYAITCYYAEKCVLSMRSRRKYLSVKFSEMIDLNSLRSAIAAIIAIIGAYIGDKMDWIADALNLDGIVSFFPTEIFGVPVMLSFVPVDTVLQRLVWTIAIIAGLVSIINGTKVWFAKKAKKRKDGNIR